MTRLLVALCCSLSLWLSGCSDSSSSSADPPSPAPMITESTAEPSPTATPTPDGPIEFAKGWVALLQELNATGNPTQLLRASHGCTGCEEVAHNIEAIYDAGGWIQSDGYDVVDPVRVIRKTDHATTLRLTIAVGASRYKKSAEAPLEATDAAESPFECVVGRVGSKLKMLDFYRIPG